MYIHFYWLAIFPERAIEQPSPDGGEIAKNFLNTLCEKVKTAQFTDLPNIRARNVCVLLPGARAHGPRPELAGSRLRPGYLHNYKYVRFQCQLRKEGCFQAALSHLDLTHQVLHLFLAPHLQPF